jgi:hypothetical protein
MRALALQTRPDNEVAHLLDRHVDARFPAPAELENMTPIASQHEAIGITPECLERVGICAEHGDPGFGIGVYIVAP